MVERGDPSEGEEGEFGLGAGSRDALLPPERPRTFRATVHGTLFEQREEALERLSAGDPVTLIPDPPVEDEPEVWVHLRSGDPVGRLPSEIGEWLAPWLLGGGCAEATALRVSGRETPSWRRLLIEVRCREGAL